jgi:hypothetical protein
MIAVLSPSKTMDFRHPPGMPGRSLPRMLDQTNGLAHLLRTKSAAQLRKLMDVSDALAREAQQHFLNYSEEHSDANTKPAIYAFSGDVYRGLDAASLSDREVEYCERHVRILSGFYGLLRPLDRIQPYRLEMGLALKVGKCPDLYAYWKPHIGKWLSADLAGPSLRQSSTWHRRSITLRSRWKTFRYPSSTSIFAKWPEAKWSSGALMQSGHGAPWRVTWPMPGAARSANSNNSTLEVMLLNRTLQTPTTGIS